MRSTSTPIIGMVVYLAGVTVTSAQVAPAGFLNVTLGATQPVSTAFKSVWSVGGNTAEADYSIKRAPIFDIAGGVHLGQRFGVGVAVSHTRNEQPATVSLTIPILRGPSTATKNSDPLPRSETALHIELMYRLPNAGGVGLTVFGGPSRFNAKQKLVSDFNAAPAGPLSFAVANVRTEQQDASAWGFNVGADAGYFFVKSFGVGALVRYGRATVELPNLLQRPVTNRTVNEDVDVGGLLVGGGVRLRF